MDAFKSLAVGTRFDEAKNQTAMKLFRAGQTTKHQLMGAAAVGLTQDSVASRASSSLAVPAPTSSLDLFGDVRRADAAHDGGEPADGAVGAPAVGADGQTAVDDGQRDRPLKSMTFKKKKHIWRKNDLTVTGVDLPDPIAHFSDLARPPLSVPHNVVTNLFSRQHRVPTPVQMQAIPSLIHGRDVLACAPTGSGKTIAFLVPLFARLKQPDTERGVRALVVSPTVELAQQIEREAFFLMKGQRWRFVQHGQTTKNKDIFVSTPGRVVSLVEQNLLDLSKVEYLVFDEGDRLWDTKTDFLPVVDKILAACTHTEKVVCLFTATLSEKVEAAARSVMSSDPVRIIVRGRQSVNTHVTQKLVFCGNELGKVVAMRNLIREGITPPVLVFVQSIERTKELYDEIRAQGLHIAVMNAKMTVEEREETVMKFRLGKTWVLVTTELLSRGIDFKNVGTVVNFDFPPTVDSYIHRVGRTGRAGKSGTAITFFTEDDRQRLPAVAKVVKESGSEVEGWMLDIKVSRGMRRLLEHSTPKRMVVSSRKRMRIADQRIERQYRRLEREQGQTNASKRDAEADDGSVKADE